MAFADDLLDLAEHLANLDPQKPRQASLRRAVSTAYYALFHLLISEATRNWNHAEHRPSLGRVFEHGKMKNASVEMLADLNRARNSNSSWPLESAVSQSISIVVKSFIKAQESRNKADYDTAKEWTRLDVLAQIEAVSDAFNSWNVIRDEPLAQEYLVSLLLGKKRRPE